LRKEPDVEVTLIDGDRGELTVLVDGQVVARKGESMPSAEQVLAAFKKAPV
jgi:hypothetical protein